MLVRAEHGTSVCPYYTDGYHHCKSRAGKQGVGPDVKVSFLRISQVGLAAESISSLMVPISAVSGGGVGLEIKGHLSKL